MHMCKWILISGLYCNENVDNCDPNHCRNGATCIDHVNNFTCHCSEGYTGHLCHIKIAAIFYQFSNFLKIDCSNFMYRWSKFVCMSMPKWFYWRSL